MFLIDLTYKKPLEEVDKYLQEHIAFLDKYYALGKFIFSGRKNPRTGGGIILVQHCNGEEIKQIIAEDPFNKNDIASYNVQEFIPTKYAEAFSSFVR
jgi:uncharacterized protein YciI